MNRRQRRVRSYRYTLTRSELFEIAWVHNSIDDGGVGNRHGAHGRLATLLGFH